LPAGSLFIDTSAWVEYLRGPSEEIEEAIDLALEQGRAVTAGVVLTELLQGAKDDAALRQVETLYEALPSLPIEDETWRKAGKLSYAYRKRGILFPLPDLLIAQLCIENGAGLLTTDRHFEKIREVRLHRGKVFPPSPR
jgi:predicted nucleic acid-binding protein